ncbi:hypothetical protein M9H77_22350 [Catharanthus roseus]|uniref:Uncharacterized protein n=1 Tax=Catharanthus roseus TaxID=4058 RepID=A0ACC0APW1_CATRO|nr:hypothetical protein M9H77_22350 [Catharanthus roseus]
MDPTVCGNTYRVIGPSLTNPTFSRKLGKSVAELLSKIKQFTHVHDYADYGHDIENCNELKKEIKKAIREGELTEFIDKAAAKRFERFEGQTKSIADEIKNRSRKVKTERIGDGRLPPYHPRYKQ